MDRRWYGEQEDGYIDERVTNNYKRGVRIDLGHLGNDKRGEEEYEYENSEVS
jgi:hypothetical protein